MCVNDIRRRALHLDYLLTKIYKLYKTIIEETIGKIFLLNL